jgi:hypothetical protein
MKIGWSRSKVNNYMLLLKEIDTPILELAKKHQTGRVSKNDTGVSFNFTDLSYISESFINSPQIFN